MGNLIIWQESPADSTWTKTEIYRASTSNGTYSKIATLDISYVSGFTYYDQNGESTSYYKIRFTNDDATQTTDYSSPVQGKQRYLYTDPKEVLRISGLIPETLPNTIDNNTLYDWIYDVSKNVDKLSKQVYGRTEAFEEIQSSRYLNSKQNLLLDHKNVSDVSVYFRTDIAPDETGEYTWVKKREGYDYQIFPEGRIKLFTWPIVQQPYNYRDIKIVGTYGQLTIPPEIEQLTKYLVAIRIFVHLTGGSYNDVTAWSLGEYNESLGEPYTNLRATIVMLENEIKRIKKQTGIKDTLINLRYA